MCYAIFFAAQIHSKGMKLTPESPAIFQFCVITRELKDAFLPNDSHN